MNQIPIYKVFKFFLFSWVIISFLILQAESSAITVMHKQLTLSLGIFLPKKYLFLPLQYFRLVFKYFLLKSGWLSNAFPNFFISFYQSILFDLKRHAFGFFETIDIPIPLGTLTLRVRTVGFKIETTNQFRCTGFLCKFWLVFPKIQCRI